MNCPECGSPEYVQNGSVRGKPKCSCKACGRQYTVNPTKKIIPPETWEMVDKLLLEKIPLAGISRVTGISESWLQEYVNKKYESTPREVNVKKKREGG